jgi:zinc/manganese transport system ATP-binding protein
VTRRASTTTTATTATTAALARLEHATLRIGDRVLWSDLDLEVAPGEFLAVLGPNGAGKTTLLKVMLGLLRLSVGSVEIAGAPPRRGDHRIGYVPQQKGFDGDLPIRGRDLVRFGLDGHRFGVPLPNRAVRNRVDAAIDAVGATAYADQPIGRLSGGEQQRLRIAQALVGDPELLLCDEPLLSLDLANQQAVSTLIHDRAVDTGTGVVFVTHDINPILDHVDRVLYLVDGRWAVGTPREVMTTEQLTRLYGTPVDVLDVRGRIVVVGSHDSGHDPHGHHHVEHPRGRHT